MAQLTRNLAALADENEALRSKNVQLEREVNAMHMIGLFFAPHLGNVVTFRWQRCARQTRCRFSQFPLIAEQQFSLRVHNFN